MYGIRILPEICASTVCPFSSSTRNIALGRGSTTVPSTSITSSLATLRVSPIGLSPRCGRTRQRASEPGSRQYRSRSARMSRNRSAGAIPGPFAARSSAVLSHVHGSWETGPDAHRERGRGHHRCGAVLLVDPCHRARPDLARPDADIGPPGHPDADAVARSDRDADPDGLPEPERQPDDRPLALRRPQPLDLTGRAGACGWPAVVAAAGAF